MGQIGAPLSRDSHVYIKGNQHGIKVKKTVGESESQSQAFGSWCKSWF